MLLATMDVNSIRAGTCPESEIEVARKQAQSRVKTGLKLNPKNALVGIHMAERFLTRGSHEKAIAFADAALKNSRDVSITSIAYVLKGRACQLTADYTTALEMFQNAVSQDSKSLAAQFGLGQMLCFEG